MEIRPDTLLSRNPDIVFSEIDDEVVMMITDFEKYFGMEACAARIWEILEQEVTFSGLCEQLVSEFEVELEECMEQSREFVTNLCENELVLAKTGKAGA